MSTLSTWRCRIWAGTGTLKKKYWGAVGKPIDLLAREFLNGGSEEEIKELTELAVNYELELIPKQAQMYPDAMQTIISLYNNGHALSVCSNGTTGYIF
ncbi:MAG: hypothetical protein PHO15_06940 [Eubacteriales bacterium]|nr:hypothetical protein [Eubacteriales bacterium]